MMNFLITNEINDINNVHITHYSQDKGHFLAKSFAKIGHKVYFLTATNNCEKDGLYYVSCDKINEEFLQKINYIFITREALFPIILEAFPALRNIISINKNKRTLKIIIKNEYPLWFYDKEIRKYIHKTFQCGNSLKNMTKWVVNHIDYLCAQNEEYRNIAVQKGIPREIIPVSNMGVPNYYFDYSTLVNPYDLNHSYCVNMACDLATGRALWPRYYVDNPDKRQEFNTEKYIIVYTGRIKVDHGKIFYNMRNIMNYLGEKYELHIFPGTFMMPSETGSTTHSARNGNSLVLLRDTIFQDSQNIIIHYPYDHHDKYMYLNFAHCGIDFSEVRPNNSISIAGHAKILEYCEIGLPVVCEENINNLYLVKNGKNGIVLPYLASDQEYADAIKNIIENKNIDREYCRKITIDNENWDLKAKELLSQIK